MYQFFIGCDMSKAYFDSSITYDGQIQYLGRFSNDLLGFEQFFIQLRASTRSDQSDWFICFENTGVYSKKFLYWANANGISALEENALSIFRSLGLRRGKDDRIDSKAICRYAFEKRDRIQPTQLANPLIIKLKKLLSRRDLLLRQHQALKVSLKEQEDILDFDLKKMFQESNQILISTYKAQIKKIELKIKQLINDNEDLKRNHQLAQSVIGVGFICSASMIAFTNNFNSFNCSRKFACYCGIAPFPNSSGIRRSNNRVSHLANKRLKSLLTMSSISAIRYDNQIKEYFNRKKAEGKQGTLVLNAIKNKIIHRVFAVIKRQSPYVNIHAYK